MSLHSFKIDCTHTCLSYHTIDNILDAGGLTFVRKKSCSITSRRWTFLFLGDMKRNCNWSPYSFGWRSYFQLFVNSNPNITTMYMNHICLIILTYLIKIKKWKKFVIMKFPWPITHTLVSLEWFNYQYTHF